jgi:hypothetical protein
MLSDSCRRSPHRSAGSSCIATIMSEVLGEPARFQQIAFDAYKGGFVSFCMREAMAFGSRARIG